MQRYPLISSTHVAPKAQGEDWHSLISVTGRKRKNITLQSEKKEIMRDLPAGALCSFSSVYSGIDSC